MNRILLPGLMICLLAACGPSRTRREEIRLLYEQQLHDDSLLARQLQALLRRRPDSLPLDPDSLLFPFRFPKPDSLPPASDSLAPPQ